MSEEIKIIPDSLYLEWHEKLLQSASKLKEYRDKRGYTLKTIIEHKIGWDSKAERYTIPVFNEIGQCLDARMYTMRPAEGRPKIRSYKAGYGGARLYPMPDLSALRAGDQVIVVEGEHDALCLKQHGFNAVSNTCGAGTWRDEWSRWFDSIDVVVCYDCDKAGREGADKVIKSLYAGAKSVRNIQLGLKDGEDVTDFFVKYKKKADDFKLLIKNKAPEDLFEQVNLSQAVDGKRSGTAMKWTGSIVGKDLSPYQVPYRVEIKCDSKGTGRSCAGCPLSEGKREYSKIFDYEKDKEWLIKFVGCSDSQLNGFVRQACGIPSSMKCRDVDIKVTERQCLEDASIIPETDYKQDAKYALHRLIYIGTDLDTNQTYTFRGTSLPDPNSQMALFVVKEAVSTRDGISRFKLTREILDGLEILKAERISEEKIQERIDAITSNLSGNVTKIYGRDNLVLAVLLVYHSALSFSFLENEEQKGWLECAIVGDTETGKTETVKKLIYHFKAGEFISSGENTSRSGILGGLQQTHNGKWSVTWGKLPLNDRGLLAIDEMENLSKQGLVGQLSGVRSSGIAELVQIQTQRTMARTRIIWIANPIEGRMRDHNYAIEAVRDLFKDQQDIRRIDFAIGCKKEEISDGEINQRRRAKSELIYTTEVMHNSIMRMWNMPAEKIKFTEGAEDAILAHATLMGSQYAVDIPLLLGTGGRSKIARMAVALAGLTMSGTDGTDVVVEEAHVNVVVRYLKSLYDSDVLAYAEYSRVQNKSRNFDKSPWMKNNINTVHMIDDILSTSGMQMSDFMEIFKCTRDVAEGRVSEMREHGAIVRKYQYYVKTPQFIRWLKDKKEALIKTEYEQGEFV